MSITLIYETPCKEKSYLHTVTYETLCKDYMTQRVRLFETNEAFRLRCNDAWSRLLKYCTGGVFKFKHIDPDEDFDYMVDEFLEDVCRTVEDRDYECLSPILPTCVGCQHNSLGQRDHMQSGGCLHDSNRCMEEDCPTCDQTCQCDKCGDMVELAVGESFTGFCLSCELERIRLGEPKPCACGEAVMSDTVNECEDCYYQYRTRHCS